MQMQALKSYDQQIYDAIKHEERRQSDGMELIPSENYVSVPVLDAMGSLMTNKYSEGYITPPFSIDGGFSIIKVYKKDKSRIKTYEEAKPEVLSGYNEQEQKAMEEVYINSLKSKYKPVFFYDALQDAFKN